MKKIFLAAGILFGLAGCSSSDDPGSATTAASVISTVTQGTWRISQFSEDGSDQTDNFNDYHFTFADTGVLTAANGTDTYNGAWAATTEGSDDGNPGDVNLYVFFPSPENLAGLSDDYHILERTSAKIRLQHVSGDGGTELLTFQKE
jgi:hypothetical protein